MSATLSRMISPRLPRPDPAARLPGEGTVAEEAARLFAQPDQWLAQPHPELAGRSPAECLAAGDETVVRSLLRRIRYAPMT